MEFMGEVEGEEIGAMRVAARGAMRTKNCLEFFTVSLMLAPMMRLEFFWTFWRIELRVSRNYLWGASWHG